MTDARSTVYTFFNVTSDEAARDAIIAHLDGVEGLVYTVEPQYPAYPAEYAMNGVTATFRGHFWSSYPNAEVYGKTEIEAMIHLMAYLLTRKREG